MKPMALILAAAMTASCVSTQENNRPEVGKAEPGLLSRGQTTCPVMEGKRINNRLYVDYQGFRIYVCCNPCVKAVRRDPDKYLKKLRDMGIVIEKTGLPVISSRSG